MGSKIGAPHPKFIWQSQYKREIQTLSAIQKMLSPFLLNSAPAGGYFIRLLVAEEF